MTRAKPPAEAAREAPDRGTFINGLAKGLAVIQAFHEEEMALTLSQVAERAGLTRATARRVLMTLEELGFATRSDARHFMLTPRVLSLGYAYLSSMPLWGFAEPVIESLVQELGETCSVAVLDGTEMVYVLRVPVHRILSQGVTIGSRLPLYCNSMGRVLLSGLPQAQLDEYLATVQLVPFTAGTITDPKRLRDVIEEVRRKGYAWVSGEMEERVGGLSVPIFSREGRVIAALNASVNGSKMTEPAIVKRFLPQLRLGAQRLHASLLAKAGNQYRVSLSRPARGTHTA